nr:MAG TPA: hypothetical protein [Caudoviricetes sp.]
MTNGKASHFAVLFLYLENYVFMKMGHRSFSCDRCFFSAMTREVCAGGKQD